MTKMNSQDFKSTYNILIKGKDEFVYKNKTLYYN